MGGLIRLFHGSERIVEHPQFGFGKRAYGYDYGKGFYCTMSEELAKEWAGNQGERAFLNKYELDTTGLDILDLMNESPMAWIAILLENRRFADRYDSDPLGIGLRDNVYKHTSLSSFIS